MFLRHQQPATRLIVAMTFITIGYWIGLVAGMIFSLRRLLVVTCWFQSASK
jgi:hypothetical protein